MPEFIHVSMKMFLDRSAFIARAEKKQRTVLFRSGAYAATSIKRQIRAATRSQRRLVSIGSMTFIVPYRGRVLNAATLKPVGAKLAKQARLKFWAERPKQEAGQPPRRGPGDLLRRRTFFGVDEATETVVAGPEKFDEQPALLGVVSVPQLLEEGGRETALIGGQHIEMHFAPHPFVEPVREPAEKFFERQIEAVDL